MKKIFVGLIAACFVTAASASNVDWKITKVFSEDKSVAGFIYHTSAIGTQIGQKTEKVISGLRLVCSGKEPTKWSEDPVIVIFWDKSDGSETQTVEIRTDKTNSELSQWEQDGPLLVRSIPESKELMKSLRTNKNIGFTWTDSNSVKRTTLFSLRNFNTHIDEFNTLCNTQL